MFCGVFIGSDCLLEIGRVKFPHLEHTELDMQVLKSILDFCSLGDRV